MRPGPRWSRREKCDGPLGWSLSTPDDQGTQAALTLVIADLAQTSARNGHDSSALHQASFRQFRKRADITVIVGAALQFRTRPGDELLEARGEIDVAALTELGLEQGDIGDIVTNVAGAITAGDADLAIITEQAPKLGRNRVDRRSDARADIHRLGFGRGVGYRRAI